MIVSHPLSGVGGKGGKKKKTKATSKPSKANGSNWANVPLPPPPVHPLPGTEIDHYPNEHHEGGGYVCLECRDIVEIKEEMFQETRKDQIQSASISTVFKINSIISD